MKNGFQGGWQACAGNPHRVGAKCERLAMAVQKTLTPLAISHDRSPREGSDHEQAPLVPQRLVAGLRLGHEGVAALALQLVSLG